MKVVMAVEECSFEIGSGDHALLLPAVVCF